MIRLLTVSVVWALSFGLLKHRLADVPPDLVNAIRLTLALLVFAPWLARGRALASKWILIGIGAVQFGLMYTAYTRAFAFLAGHEVALATVLTPLYVTLFDDLLARRIRWRFLAAASLSVAGTVVAAGAGRPRGAWVGLLLLQVANLAFAVGQIGYRRIVGTRIDKRDPGRSSDAPAMAWAYAGGALVAAIAALPHLPALPSIAPEDWVALAWLGLVASGLCFFLWNSGARRVNTGVLAVMNDAKIPLGAIVSLVVFGESADGPRLFSGCALIALAWWIAWRERFPSSRGRS